MYMFFFFKQKTAYEMRISDWSSDVCSSDLRRSHAQAAVGAPTAALPVEGQLQRHAHGIPAEAVPRCALRAAAARSCRPHRLADEAAAAVLRGRAGGQRGEPGRAAGEGRAGGARKLVRSEEHTSELPSLMRNTYAV